VGAAFSRMFLLIPILIAWVTLESSPAFAQVMQDSSVAGHRARSGMNVSQGFGELEAIEFMGLNETAKEDLIGVIVSRESDISFTRRLTYYYYENLRRNPSTPKQIMQTLSKVQKNLEDELRYFNPDMASDDSVALLKYLDQNGFHNATVTWKFEYNLSTYLNTLTFYVEEGPRAQIDTVVYRGLYKVPDSVLKEINDVRDIERGDPYSEAAFEKELRAIVAVLQNNGYYRAYFEPPVVSISDDGKHDTLLAKIEPGSRVRIRQIVFTEDLNGYPSVNESMRRRQLEFQEGDWYSKLKLNQTRASLIGLGCFEIVAIDTITVVFLDSTDMSDADSAVAIEVFTRNAKVYDVGTNFLFFQTAVDNYLNVGVGATAQYKNTFGGAQVSSVTAQYILQDISRILQGQPLESEALLSFVLAWPSLARVGGIRLGLQTNTYYSYRLLVYPFRLASFGLGGRLPVNLYSYTLFNGFDFNLSLERQVPENFDQALETALGDARTPQDTATVLSTYNQFSVLDAYLNDPNSMWFTGIYPGFNLRGEHRDNLVNPRRGYFLNFSVEGGFGAGEFIRFQFFNTAVTALNPRLILATKVKLGHIQLLNFKPGSAIDTNTYVPLERQFFAGGAASIRSYPSRLLHDPHSGVVDLENNSQENIYSNVVGSGTLIELGIEFRYTFGRPRGWNPLWASIVERSGITFFIDAGNAFNRLTVDLYGTMRFEDVYKGSVLAAGLGYRFDTPVGPVRIDYATSVYDPLRTAGRWIFNGRTNIMGGANWQLSIGLGHAF
jgi:outer membrane protein assembly factor BamA